MKKLNIAYLLILASQAVAAQNLYVIDYNKTSGAVESIRNKVDKYTMNFVYEPNEKSQEAYKVNRWGLGGCTIVAGGREIAFQWLVPVRNEIKQNDSHTVYENEQLQIEVKRKAGSNGRFEENYRIRNMTRSTLQIKDLYIHTPFNDEYPNAKTCVTNRCNTHIWAGGDASYINATRMGGEAPHLGMVVTKGYVSGYSITGKSTSNERGVISLNFRPFELATGMSNTITWQLFWNTGWGDFYKQALQLGWVKASSNYYTLQKGEKAVISFEGNNLKKAVCSINGTRVHSSRISNQLVVSTDTLSIGEHSVTIRWDGGKETWVKLLVTSPFLPLIKKRLDFILAHQQVTDPKSLKYGAFLLYDNETDSIVHWNGDPRLVDRDEGGERNGMGVVMAQYAGLNSDTTYIAAARRYADFVRYRLQTLDYKIYSNVQHTSRHRGYNYILAANVYQEMYRTTGEEIYLANFYNTILKFYKEFPDFYAIGIPCKALIDALTAAGKTEEREIALALFRKQADMFLRNGILVPEHEVNYEQTIIAPSVALLCEFYLVTGEQKYLHAAKAQMPALLSFNGFQPDYHLNDIAIRHWDGYWFGKRRMWGDVMPHYWSAFSGYTFWVYSQATGDQSFAKRAQDVVRNNMCQFFEDGRSSCAYIYPDQVNGKPGKFFDPFASDQDNALIYFLDIYKGLKP